jgi:hypothetical protein
MEVKIMAQTKKAEENEQTPQTQLEANEQTQTPPSRQAGANQPQHLQDNRSLQGLTRSGGSETNNQQTKSAA